MVHAVEPLVHGLEALVLSGKPSVYFSKSGMHLGETPVDELSMLTKMFLQRLVTHHSLENRDSLFERLV